MPLIRLEWLVMCVLWKSKYILKQIKQVNPLRLTCTLQRYLLHCLMTVCMVCGLLCLQLSRVLFSQCQSAANGGVGGGLHFSAFFSVLQMVAFRCSLEWPPQHKISTCKLNEGSYIRRIFNCFNHSAASNIQQASQKFHAGKKKKKDPLWSERVSTQQCCASDFVSVCKMKVVSGSLRDSLSCLWHKGLASECLLPKKMFESEEDSDNIKRSEAESFKSLCAGGLQEWGQLWPFCGRKSLLVKLNKRLLQKLFLRKCFSSN